MKRPEEDQEGGRVRALVDPLTEFLREESTGGLALVAAAVVALIWANSPADSAYFDLWHTELTLGPISEDLQHWVNDALMAVFFFVVGLEIKRELVWGELADRRTAILPALAAVGGVALPALIFVAVTTGAAPEAKGWAIPAATDIAFAVGVLTLLGDRVSSGAKLFLLSIAIVDDIVAIAIIAVFYSEGIAIGWLGGALAAFAMVLALRRAGVTHMAVYIVVGLVAWFATFESGVHATIAGVVLGLLTPTGKVGGREVLRDVEHALHPVSAFAIVPLFALANAGVSFRGGILGDALQSTLAWAIVAGLVVGKLVGIAGATAAALRTGAGVLPEGMAKRQLPGVAALGGIGFTVSLFIAGLAFEDNPELSDVAKIGIFAGSLVSAAIGTALLAGRSRGGADERRADGRR